MSEAWDRGELSPMEREDPDPMTAQGQTEPTTRDEAERLAKVLGDIRIEQARQADWWTSDEDHALLAQVLRGECAAWAPGVLAAGYLSPAEVERQITAARAQALRDAARDLPGFDGIRTHGDAARWLRDRADTTATKSPTSA